MPTRWILKPVAMSNRSTDSLHIGKTLCMNIVDKNNRFERGRLHFL